MNIVKEVDERVDLFSVSWLFLGNTNIQEVEKEIFKYNFLSNNHEVTFIFYQNNSVIHESNSWGELSSKLNPLLWDHDEKLKVSCTFDKTTVTGLIIIDQKEFIKTLPKSTRKIIEFWNETLLNNKNISIYNNSIIDIKLSTIDKKRTKRLFSDLEICNTISITPENLFYFGEQLKKSELSLLHRHIIQVTSLFCLKVFCSKFRENPDAQFIFEGYNSYSIENPEKNKLVDVADTLYTIYQWIFSDSNTSSKLGILRNLVSLSNTNDFRTCFSQNLLKSLFSNHQVYMKENIKQYFEIKNKVTEFMFNLLNKSFDIYDQYKITSRNTALAVLSYFFTVIVIKSISKQKTDVLFSPEIASISIVFILSAIIYVFMIHSDLIKKNSSIKISVSELKSRYEQILCEDEIEEIFNSKSLSNSLNDNSTNNYHLYVVGVLFAILICVIYFSISNLGLDFFVKLIIY
ncbi:hypothetical protein GCM10007978_39720 [Shewanella hanedai]|uniref:Uncharacterized protein n=1 Tax=Shewanella hanedai TaxID=25 RepID=A0A553JSE8_SHEHA|nr:hypothetical protein [Shewanella hanedai]TRY15383.1 hypothetical protein FN961_04795 [Shewanella hanedai]GGI98002.1 hypothetical protein GCM10007978_39720 [Shewanella hanedai]